MPGKRIVFATFGSLGDLHPCIAIARELARRGHRPLIATFDVLREAVAQAGVEFAPLRPATAGFGEPDAVMRRLVDPWSGPRFLVRDMFMAHLRETYEDLERACGDADLLVTHPLAFAGVLLAEHRGLRWASTVLSPFSLLSAHDPPLLPTAPWLRSVGLVAPGLYRELFRLPRSVMRRWETPLRGMREEFGLPLPGPLAGMEGQYSPQLNLALFSAVLAARQPDWPANTVVCGFPRYDGPPPDDATRADLGAFLAAGDAPLVFALGSSAVMVAGKFWMHAIEAARSIGRRAILLTGAAPEALGSLPDTVRAFRYLPYSLVFPHTAAVVHSGGIGTLSQALAAGRPQLVVPVAFDQPDNARRAVALGVARSIPFRRVTATALAGELSTLLRAREYAATAGPIGDGVRAEDAAAIACDALLAAQACMPAGFSATLGPRGS